MTAPDAAALAEPVGASFRRELDAWVLYQNAGDRIGQIDGYENRWIVDIILAALRAKPAGEAVGQCDCFGDSGLQASTYAGENGERRCDMCGLPVSTRPATTGGDGMREALEDVLRYIRGEVSGSGQRDGILREGDAALAQPPADRDAIKATALERVARALCKYNCAGSDPDEMFEGSPLWDVFSDEAQVAIRALGAAT